MSQTLQSLLVQRAVSPNRRKSNLWCLHPFLHSGWSSEPPANDDSPRAHHKFREARIKRYNYFINFTSVNCGISHLQAHPGHPQDSGVFTGDSFQEGG